MGLFKAVKDLTGVTKQAKELAEQQRVQAGYKPGVAGMVDQMEDMIGQMNEGLQDLTEGSSDQQRVLATGVPGEAVIVAMSTPARGAQYFNIDLDLEVHVSGQAPYRVKNQYIVPSSAPLAQGFRLPVKVDPQDPAVIAIDWANVAPAPERGEVRPVDAAAQPPSGTAAAGDDVITQLEKLAKLRDAGVLNETEFAEQKARILGHG